MKLFLLNCLHVRYALFIFISLVFIHANAQVFDGHYCPGPSVAGDEYANAEHASFIPPSSSTCNVFDVYGLLDKSTQGDETILLGVVHGNGGQATFRFFINTDCDNATGSLLEPLRQGQAPVTGVSGAEYRVDISANSSGATIYEFTGLNPDGTGIWSDITSTTAGFSAMQGVVDDDGTCNGQSSFIELNNPLAYFFDPCDNTNNCGSVELTAVLSNAGNSPTSQFCQSESFSIVVNVNHPPVADFTLEPFMCQYEDLSFPTIMIEPVGTDDLDLALGDELEYSWSTDYMGTFSNEVGTGATSTSMIQTEYQPMSTGMHTITLTVTDNFGCQSSTVASATYQIEIMDAAEAFCVALPVELSDFSVDSHQGIASLQWVTQSESNTQEFIVQWSSDGQYFEDVGTVQAQGNSTTEQNYHYLHDLSGGNNYYRLKILDFDMSYEYSTMKHVYYEQSVSNKMIQFVNNNQLYLADMLHSISIYDSNGSLVYQQNQPSDIIDVSHLARGLYILIDREQNQTEKFFK